MQFIRRNITFNSFKATSFFDLIRRTTVNHFNSIDSSVKSIHFLSQFIILIVYIQKSKFIMITFCEISLLSNNFNAGIIIISH